MVMGSVQKKKKERKTREGVCRNGTCKCDVEDMLVTDTTRFFLLTDELIYSRTCVKRPLTGPKNCGYF